jgi:mRNA interferase MazF
MSFLRNEIVLLPIPFTDLSSRKVRPAIVIGHSEHSGDLFVAPISSQLRNLSVVLRDWKSAGLNVPCGIKSQLATIEHRLILKSVGTLSQYDTAVLDDRLRRWLHL